MLPLLQVPHLPGADATSGIIIEDADRFDTDRNDILGRALTNDIGAYIEAGRNWAAYAPVYDGPASDRQDWNGAKFSGANSLMVEDSDGQRALAFPSASSGSFTANITAGNNVLTGVSSLIGLALGQPITHVNIPANAYIYKMSGTSITFAVVGKKPGSAGTVATGTASASTVAAVSISPASSQMLATSQSLLPTSGGWSMALIVKPTATPSGASYFYSTSTGPVGQRFAMGTNPNLAATANNLSTGGDQNQTGAAALAVATRSLIFFEIREGTPKVSRIGVRNLSAAVIANWNAGVSASTGGEALGSNTAVAPHLLFARAYFPFALSTKANGQALLDALAAYYGIA